VLSVSVDASLWLPSAFHVVAATFLSSFLPATASRRAVFPPRQPPPAPIPSSSYSAQAHDLASVGGEVHWRYSPRSLAPPAHLLTANPLPLFPSSLLSSHLSSHLRRLPPLAPSSSAAPQPRHPLPPALDCRKLIYPDLFLFIHTPLTSCLLHFFAFCLLARVSRASRSESPPIQFSARSSASTSTTPGRTRL
jgi:hypothetical protein